MAYKVSEKYNEVIYSGDAKHKLKLLFNGVEYETANVKTESVKIKDNILSNGEERFSLDNFVSKEAEIIIHDIELSDIVGPVSISIGTLVDTEYEYVPIGIFNIQETPTTDNGKTTIKLRDNSVKFDYPYDASEIIEKNGGSVTMLALLQDICTKFSVELGTTDFANKDTTISVWDNTINARQYIMYIAEKAGCIAKIDRQGKLILADINKGEDITITSSSKSLQPKNNLARPLSQLKIQGKSEQETRSGKNLLGLKDKLTTTSYGLTYSISDNEITINGTATASDRLVLDELINPIKFDSSTKYRISIVSSGSVSKTNWSIQIRTSNSNIFTAEYDGLMKTSYRILDTNETATYLGLYIGSGTTFTNFKIKVQIEEGETATEYEPYGASPSPDYPSEINSISGIENLFDKDNYLTIDGFINASTYAIQASTNSQKSTYVKVKPNTQYYISDFVFNSAIVVGTFTDIPKIGDVATNYVIKTASTIDLTITTGENDNYIVFMISNASSTTDTSKMQIAKGSKKKPYVPYGRYLRIDNVGKNKFDKNNITKGYRLDSLGNNYADSSYFVSEYIPVKEKTNYVVNYSVEQVYRICLYDSNKKLITVTYGSSTFYTPENTKYLRLCQLQTSIDDIQLEENIESTEYEDYRNDVTYVNLAKENLFDKNNVTLNYRLGNDGLPYADNNYFLSDFISVDNSSSYIYTRIGEDLNEALCYYDENKNFILRKTDLSTSNTYKFTTTETTKYIRIADSINSLDIGKLYKGSSPKDYYDLCSIGDTKDELKVVSGKGTQRIRHLQLKVSDMNNSENYPGWNNVDEILLDYPEKNGQFLTFGINYKSNIAIQPESSPDYFAINTKSGNKVLFLNKAKCGDDFTQTYWKTNYPDLVIDLYYVIPTPEEFTLEPTQVKLYEDINDISLIDDIETELEATYSGKKEHIQIPVNLLESYKVGDKLKISRVVYEDAIRKFEYGTENDETLYINSANPYITDSTEVQKIYENIRGYELYSLSTGKIIGNPALDSDDIIEYTYNDETYYTLGQNELTYNGVLIQKFNTLIGTKEKTKENVTLNTEDSKYKRIFTRINQAEGNIELNTSQITNVQSNLKDNYYTIEQANQLIQNAETGVTNTFSEAGGNNIFRNTGLWFKQSDSNNPYEFWQGLVSRVTEERASNSNALLLQSGSLIQEQTVPNGKYTISFKYKKVIELSNIKVKINAVTTELNGVEETEFIQNIEVNSNHINVEFISDTNNGCEIYDLMVNAGNVKLAYSQNQNETTTDTVNISKGITITSTDTDTTFKANADGIRTYDKNENRLTEFTDTGMITKKQIVEDEAEIVGILIQRVSKQTWLTKI